MTPIEVSIGQSAYDWWELVPAIIGAVIGALAGGIPAYLLAVRSSKEAATKENQLLTAKIRASATSIFLRFQNILNDAVGTLLMIEEMFADMRTACELEPYRLQRRVRPLANIDFLSYAEFSPDDLSILVKADRIEVLQDLMLIGHRYNAVLNSLRTYGVLKDNLYKQLLEGPEHQIGPDGKVTSTIKNEEIARLRLHEAQAESVIAPTITQLRELVDGVLDRAEVIGDDLKSAIGDGEKFLAFDLTHVQTIRTSVETSRAGLEYVADAPNVVELPRVRK